MNVIKNVIMFTYYLHKFKETTHMATMITHVGSKYSVGIPRGMPLQRQAVWFVCAIYKHLNCSIGCRSWFFFIRSLVRIYWLFQT